MFALSPDDPDLGELRPLAEAIDELCGILEGDREAVIRELAEIIRRRAEFEILKRRADELS